MHDDWWKNHEEELLALDKNSRASIDYLCHPTGVIKEAEKLAAQAFGAKHAFFMVGGTTSSVQAMVMSACFPGDKIILPRNVHCSVINAIILAGAVPVYIDPPVHPRLGISLGIRVEDVRSCIEQNPDAKAVLVNNPTYYGICSDIRTIASIAHEHGMLVLADEAHGTHFYFGDGLPLPAMHGSADLSAVSMHKTGGSLTQSSMLLSNGRVPRERIAGIIGLTQTTSASYLLLASLDLARRYLATEGRAVLKAVVEDTCRIRDTINAIGGYYAFGRECVDGDAIFDFDLAKLSVNTLGIGLAGIEVYTLLRDRYGIQLEFGDMGNVLALATVGDLPQDHTRLVEALADLKATYKQEQTNHFSYEYIAPTIVMSPREAFYANKKSLPIEDCEGLVCGDAVMCYPPGIPILAQGELITREIIDHIVYASSKGCSITGLSADGHVNVVESAFQCP